jgi:hypothetical protein
MTSVELTVMGMGPGSRVHRDAIEGVLAIDAQSGRRKERGRD